MTTPPKELSPERCHQLREGGILRLMVNLLHEHTFELQDKPEADFNMELFLMDFNRKTELRARLSQQLRTIVEYTAKNHDELKILGMLEVLRKYIERLYNFINGWKATTQDAGTLNESTDQLTELAGQAEEIIKVFETLTAYETIRPIFEQFGGVFVIVDYLHAQTRFNTKCHQLESGQIDLTQLLSVADDSELVLGDALAILPQMLLRSSHEIRLFLGNSRSLHTIMVGIAEDAYEDGDLYFVSGVYCYLLYLLYDTHNLGGNAPLGVMPSTSHLKDCGVIQFLAKFGMEIKDPETLYNVLLALDTLLALDRQIVLEFVSIDGSVDMLIDLLVPSKEKDEDVENAGWYEELRHDSTSKLDLINRHLWTQNRLDGRLLAIYESRDFAAILVQHLERIPPIHEYSGTPCFFELLWSILVSSEYQRWKFTEIGNGKEVVKRFESSDDAFYAEISKMIGDMFE